MINRRSSTIHHPQTRTNGRKSTKPIFCLPAYDYHMPSPSPDIESYLDEIGPDEFERLVADIWEEHGWETTVTSGSQDRGIDVIARQKSPIEQALLIQAKAYREENKIGSEDVRKYATLYQQESKADSIAIVTTGSFTSQSRKLADDLDVRLVDRQSLISFLENVELDDLSEADTDDPQSKAEKYEMYDNDIEFTNLKQTLSDYKNDLQAESGDHAGENVFIDDLDQRRIYEFNNGQHGVFIYTETQKNTLSGLIGKHNLEVISADNEGAEDSYTIIDVIRPELEYTDQSLDDKLDYNVMKMILIEVFNIMSEDEFDINISPY